MKPQTDSLTDFDLTPLQVTYLSPVTRGCYGLGEYEQNRVEDGVSICPHTSARCGLGSKNLEEGVYECFADLYVITVGGRAFGEYYRGMKEC